MEVKMSSGEKATRFHEVVALSLLLLLLLLEETLGGQGEEEMWKEDRRDTRKTMVIIWHNNLTPNDQNPQSLQ